MSWHIKIQVVKICRESGEEEPDDTRKLYTMEMGGKPTINALYASIHGLLQRLALLSNRLNDGD